MYQIIPLLTYINKYLVTWKEAGLCSFHLAVRGSIGFTKYQMLLILWKNGRINGQWAISITLSLEIQIIVFLFWEDIPNPDCDSCPCLVLPDILWIPYLTLSNAFITLALSHSGMWTVWGRNSVFITVLPSKVAIKIYLYWMNR